MKTLHKNEMGNYRGMCLYQNPKGQEGVKHQIRLHSQIQNLVTFVIHVYDKT